MQGLLPVQLKKKDRHTRAESVPSESGEGPVSFVLRINFLDSSIIAPALFSIVAPDTILPPPSLESYLRTSMCLRLHGNDELTG